MQYISVSCEITATPLPCRRNAIRPLHRCNKRFLHDTGTYQPSNGSSACLLCQPGYYCLNDSVLPTICPVGSFCPNGSASGITCPNGTHGSVTKLSDPSQCSKCPTGKYCVNGKITGEYGSPCKTCVQLESGKSR